MFFDSLPITIFIFFVMVAVGYAIIVLLKKEGSRELAKREYIGFGIIFILMFFAGIYAFFTDFGSY